MQLELLDYALACAAALLAGFVDAIAGGGGLITLPALLALGLPPQAAIATNKLQGVFGALAAFLEYRKLIDFKGIVIGIMATAVGSLAGSLIVLHLSNDAVKPLVLGILISVFVYSLFIKSDKPHKARMKPGLFYCIFGLTLGFYDGFIGPGTGSLWIFASLALLGKDFKQSSIDTKALNLTSNVIALIVFIYHEQMLWLLGLSMAVFQIIGAILGAKSLMKRPPAFVKKVFFVVVFSCICKVGASYLL